MVGVTLKGVSKRWGDFIGVQSVDLDIGDREFLVLLGPSGCGKTTTMRMIAGLEDPTDGAILIGGRDVTHLEPKDRDIAMVFQNYGLYPNLSVYENIRFPLKVRKVDRATHDARVRKAAGMVELDALLDRRPRELSGGQRQRVALARAIVREPAVFLMDEPLSNLDAKLRVQTRAELKALHQRLRTTTIYVTHDQIEAMTMADKIVVMHAGRVEQAGAPLDLYDRPANQFVAGFIGSPAMNFLPGTIEADGFRAEGGTLWPLPPGAQLLATPGRAVIYGVRPEHLHLAHTGPGIPLTIQVVEPTGSETQVHGRLGTLPVMGAFRERVYARPGDAIHITAEPALVHVFDRETGVRWVG